MPFTGTFLPNSLENPAFSSVRYPSVADAVKYLNTVAIPQIVAANPFIELEDFMVTEGGGNAVDVQLMFAAPSPAQRAFSPYPLLNTVKFFGVEGSDDVGVSAAIAAAIAANPNKMLYSWGVATGSAAPKRAAMLAMISGPLGP